MNEEMIEYTSKSEEEFQRIVGEVIRFNENINYRSNILDSDFSRAITAVITIAEQNAVDTFKETGRADKTLGFDSRNSEENEEFWRIALGSISCTSDFDTSFIVRDFFNRIGYKW